MPTVCMYQRFLPPDASGAGKQAFTLACALRKAGWSVILLGDFSPANEGHAPRREFEIHDIVPPVSDSYAALVGYWLRLARTLWKLRNRFDVLHIFNAGFVHAGAAPIARLLGKPVVVRSSMAGDFVRLRASRRGRARRAMLRFAQGYAVQSERLGRECLDAGFPPSSVNLIPNGVDTTVFHPVTPDERRRLRQELGLEPSARILVFHGVFVARKALQWLVEAVGPELERLNLTLLLVGGPAREEPTTGYAARLREQVQSRPWADRIILRDFQDEVQRYLQAADAYILPSLNEGLPNALLEAMAVGLVPFATRTSGTEDVVVHGGSGFLFEPRDSASLLQVLDTAFGPGAAVDLDALSSAASRRVQDAYSIDAAASRYSEIYERMAGR